MIVGCKVKMQPACGSEQKLMCCMVAVCCMNERQRSATVMVSSSALRDKIHRLLPGKMHAGKREKMDQSHSQSV